MPNLSPRRLDHTLAGNSSPAGVVGHEPKPSKQDSSCQKIVLPVRLLEHYSQIVLYESCTHCHRVLWEGALDNVEAFTRSEVVQADDSLTIEGRVSLRKVIAAIRANSAAMPMIQEN